MKMTIRPHFFRTARGHTLLVGGAAVCLAAAAAAVSFWSMPAPGLPSFAAVKAAHTRSEALLLDRHGEVIHELRIDASGRRLEWTPLAEISPALQAAVLGAEDHRFYRHRGVDWTSFAGAVRDLAGRSRPRGASTISMQLAARLREELRPSATRRSVGQKLMQIGAARALERRWSKAEILEAYLNLVAFRGELQGVAAASAGLFGKKPHGLDESESLILAALLRSPNAAAEQAGNRARRLAETLAWRIDGAALVDLSTRTLSRPYFVSPRAALAPHVARMLLKPAAGKTGPGGGNAVCTLDGGLQRYAGEALRRHLAQLRRQNVQDGAVLVADNRTGDVLAYVGNDGDLASARFVDGVQAPRQAGSTLKPFIYGIAFESRILTAASLLDDSPLDVPVQGGAYRPTNYDNQFRGLVTARVALASSLNVPAVKVLSLIGVPGAVDRLGDFGFRNLHPAEYYGLSLALGAADITLWDLVNSYRTLANGGEWSPLRLAFDPRPGLSRRAMAPEAVFLLADILSDRESRNATFSLESPLATRFWTAVKTGTSKDMRDNWCVGFSSRYTVGVWTGNFSGMPMWDVSGVTGAAPVWVEVMSFLHRSVPSLSPSPPPDVVRQAVLWGGGRVREEWFLRGSETAEVRPVAARAGIRIVYPPAGALIALDPDIPAEDQKVLLEAEAGGSPLRWVLDGASMGPASEVLLWTPAKGKHTLSLEDSAGRAVDRVAFEVRGGGATSR